jgi:Ca2+-binding EF-hand superfamily protein
MSSAYFTKRLKVPDDFPEILKSFSREILRNQPSNIYEFGANYFAEMSAQQATMMAGGGAEGEEQLFTASEMEEYLRGLFNEADSDGNGVLNPQEFKQIMIQADIGLSTEDIYEIMMQADENGDGQIEYAEFVPIAAETIQALQAREAAEQQDEEMLEDAEFAAEMALSRGMTQEELDSIILEEFKRADVNGDGHLNHDEFKQALQAEALGLTGKEIKALMLRVDENDDGVISYEEFAPLCYELLLQRFKRRIYEDMQDDNDLKVYLCDVFKSFDEEESGLLEVEALREALRVSEMGLTPLKIHSIVAAAVVGEDGMVAYEEFAHTAASMLEGFLKPLTQEEGQFMRDAARMGAHELLPGMDQNTMVAALGAAFQAADPEGTGLLGYDAAEAAVGGAGLDLSEKQVTSLVTSGLQNGYQVDYAQVMEVAWDLLVLVGREDYVASKLAGL